MKKNKLISKALVTIFLGLFVIYFVNNFDDFRALINLNPILLVVIIFGYFASIYTSGIFNKTVIVPYGKHISRIEAFRVGLISSIGNYFGPLLGGTGMRAAYLKKKVGLKYTDFVSTLYGYYVIAFLTSAILGLIAMASLRGSYQERGYLLLLSFFAGVTLILSLVVLDVKSSHLTMYIKKIFGKHANYIKILSESWQKIIKHKGMVYSLIRITLINIVLVLIINYSEFRLVGISLGLGPLLLYTCLGIFSILISLTPGALGVREAVYIFSASVIGISSTEILAVALIDRSLQFIVMSFGWLATVIAKRWFTQDLG